MSQQQQPKINEVDVRNYMRVRRARLTLDGNTFIIAGDNEQGKSSFVQAIEDAFGGSKFSPTMPIRKGATEAIVLITLTDGTGRVLKAEIVHNKSGRRLVVKDADGKTQSSPQAIMDAFWAETSFDPSLFLISKPDKQVEMLKKLGGLDFAALDKERAEKFTLRTAVNREVEKLDAVAAAKPSFPSAPKEEVSAQAILDEIEIAKKHNQRGEFLDSDIKVRKERIERYGQTVTQLREDAKEIEEQIAALQVKLRTVQTRISQGEEATATERTALEASEKARAEFQVQDVAPLQAKLAGVEETNRQVRANADKAKAVADARAKAKEADALTDRIQAIDEQKAEMIRAAKFPIEGMSLTDDEVTINGIPLAQESDSRRLAIGVEMAAAMNPGKPLMLVRHGNLFTPQNFHILEEIAAKRNLTCIVEIPGRDVKGAKLVFEDGVGVEPGTQQSELPTA